MPTFSSPALMSMDRKLLTESSPGKETVICQSIETEPIRLMIHIDTYIYQVILSLSPLRSGAYWWVPNPPPTTGTVPPRTQRFDHPRSSRVQIPA